MSLTPTFIAPSGDDIVLKLLPSGSYSYDSSQLLSPLRIGSGGTVGMPFVQNADGVGSPVPASRELGAAPGSMRTGDIGMFSSSPPPFLCYHVHCGENMCRATMRNHRSDITIQAPEGRQFPVDFQTETLDVQPSW
jgi:hypothetical protein